MMHELDKIHQEKLTECVRRWNEGESVGINDLISSEAVIETLDEEKAIVYSFDLPKILALLPFSKYVYVEICGSCVDANEFDAFKALVQTGLVIPILNNSYSSYPDPVLELLAGRPHLSVHEYSFYRYVALSQEIGGLLCNHCVDERIKDIKKLVTRKRGAVSFREKLDSLQHNISPCLDPDYELLDEVQFAFNTLDREKMDQLEDLSYAIRSIRSSQAMNAALSVKASDLSRLPEGISNECDDARNFGMNLRGMVVDGLGLKVPTDIDITQYVELLTDYRPAILEITDSVISGSDGDGTVSIGRLSDTIQGINLEIEKIRGLKRYMLYEAGVEFVGKNPTFVASAMLAGAMGLAGSVVGCLGTAAAGTAANIAKNKGKLKTGKSFTRLSSKIHADIQPNIDKLVAKYVGSDIPTMRVISLQKALDGSKLKG